MAIVAEKNLFTLHTDHSTYQMKADDLGYLLHLYYGERAEGSMEYLLHYGDRDFPEIPMMQEVTEPILWMPYLRNIQ